VWDTVWTLTNSFVVAAGEAPAEGSSQSQNPFGSMWLLFVVFIGIMYFLMIRPNQKREKERREMLARLSKGDKVVTNGGIHGTIVGLTEKTAVLRISDDPPVKVEFLRGAVSRVTPREGDETE
jgi:preprotein translocase subunit YajC